MKPRILCVAFLLSLLSSSCNRTPDLTSNEVITIINEIIADDNIAIHRVCSRFKITPMNGDHQKEFTELDMSFVLRQHRLLSHVPIRDGELKSAKAGEQQPVLVQVDSLCQQPEQHHLSFPFIPVDKSKVLIEISKNCNEPGCDKGVKRLYEKENGRWKISRSYRL